MRSRYVVEVVDDVAAPTPSAQPVFDPSLSSPMTEAEAWDEEVTVSPRRVATTEVFEEEVVEKGSDPAAYEPAPQPQVTRAEPPAYPNYPRPQDLPSVLQGKLNTPVDLPVQESQDWNSSPATISEPPDMFETQRPAVQQAWQHVSLAAAHEIPRVRTPRVPKSQRVTPEAIIDPPRESALKPGREERIERMFAQQTAPPPGQPPRTWTSQSSSPASPQSGSEKSSRYRMPPNPRVRRRRRAGLVAIGLLAFLIGSAAASAAWIRYDISQTRQLTASLATNVEQGRLAEARVQVDQLQTKQARYQFLYSLARPLAQPFLGQEKIQHVDQLLSVSASGLRIASDGFETYDTVTQAYGQFVGTQPGSALETTASMSGQLEALYTNLSGFQAEVNSLDNPFGSDLVEALKSRTKESVPTWRRSVLASQQLLDALPSLLSQSGRKQYLILLQNNAELRPTGGFIGSIGILTVENGKFVDFRVEDVYEADGQLNGFVEPPAELKKYLGEAQWYLRDVNWSPDFPTVAEQAGWFLDKTLGIQPDGVIAINLAVAQRLIAATGPIQLVDYNEVITADNLYDRAQTHAEVNFFPGSTQKRDFLSAVANALFQKLMGTGEGAGSMAAGTGANAMNSPSGSASIFPALYQSAEESQLLISLTDPKASAVFRTLGWDGSLRTPDCPPPFSAGTCFVDTVMQVEANVGVNKANQFVERKIQHTIDIQDGAALHSRRVELTNSSQSNAWPQGAYKAYFRLFVPLNSTLEVVTINGVMVPVEDITYQQDKNKQVFGVLVNVPVRSNAVVEVKYQVPLPGGWTAYALFEQKQPGTGVSATSDSLEHVVRVSSGRVTTVAPEPIMEDDQFRFASDRSRHDFFAIERE